jgi:ACS family sodium-dependent inorganic phosphate cotransporter
MLFSKVEYCMEEEEATSIIDENLISVADLQENKATMDDAIASTLNDADTSKNSMQSTKQQLDPSFTPILILCFLVTLLSALDRVAMSIAILPISKEYAFSETIKGNIASAVSYGYGLAIVPIGLAVSVASSRVLMMGGVALWSVATLGTPMMVELSNTGAEAFLFPLLAIRGVMGAAEATVLPTMQRILANWVPPEKKASILGTILAGFQVGTLSAYIVSPLVMDAMQGIDGSPEGVEGWRGLFYVYGMAGLLWMVPWWLFAKDAPESNRLLRSDEECQETFVNSMREDDASLVFEDCVIDSDGSLATNANLQCDTPFDGVKSLLQSAPWKGFVSSKGAWAMTLAHAAKNWELYNLLAWTPTFFSEQYGLNIKESALFSVVPSLCGMAGGLTAGNVADYILVTLEQDETDKQSMDDKRTHVRKVIQSIALLGPAVCLYLLSNLPEEATTAQFLLGGAVGLQAFDAAGFGAATQDKAGTRWSGLLYR